MGGSSLALVAILAQVLIAIHRPPAQSYYHLVCLYYLLAIHGTRWLLLALPLLPSARAKPVRAGTRPWEELLGLNFVGCRVPRGPARRTGIGALAR